MTGRSTFLDYSRHRQAARGALLFRRLDLLPRRRAWTLGLGFGFLIGAALAGFAPWLLGTFAFLGLLGAAAALAWSGEPLAEVAEAAAEPRPSWVGLVSIPGGIFRMGSPESEEGRFGDEGPVHEVRLSGFECMRLPVTRRLYREILGTDPGWPEGEADDRPVNNISWFEAVAFCNQLSEREGLSPCYLTDQSVVTWQTAANGYRLLTEAEWEYACRAGSTSRWSFGDDEASLGDHAWFGGNSSGEPQPVGRKKPNTWGLHDMHGNLYEWCWDWFGTYAETTTADPYGPTDGQGRVLRGGAFGNSPGGLRSANRDGVQPGGRDRGVGFRCARGPRRQPLTP